MAGGKVEDSNVAKGKKPLWQGRNVGKLTQMLNVPMDVSFEILSHLEPKDILQLSRVSQELRSMLRSPTSRHIWATARKNTVPPLHDPPEDMSEPQYAFLVFERFCQGCGQGRAQNVDYALRVRLCGGCWESDTETGKELCKFLGLSRKKEIAEVLLTLTPRGTRCYSDWGWEQGPLLALDQEAKHRYCKSQFVLAYRQYFALSGPGKDQAALKRFVEEQQAETLARRNFHRKMRHWESARDNARYHTGSNAQAERIAAIHNKLCELGYDQSEFPIYNSDWSKMLEQPRTLTTRIWNKIRPKLVAILDQLREDREAEAFKLKWTDRRKQLQDHYWKSVAQDRANVQARTLPSRADAVKLPCMKELLTAEEPDVELTEAHFLAVRASMLVEAEGYRARVKSELAKKLAAVNRPIPTPRATSPPRKRRREAGADLVAKSKASDEIDTDMDPEEEDELLENPKSMFKCYRHRTRDCYAIMSYLGLMEHSQIDHTEWNIEDFSVLRPGHGDLDVEFVSRLLSALGLESDATHSELDVLIRSGRPQCSCGKDPTPFFESEPKWMVLGRLIQHSQLPWKQPWQSGNLQAASTETVDEHHITFVPFEVSDIPTGAGEVSS